MVLNLRFIFGNYRETIININSLINIITFQDCAIKKQQGFIRRPRLLIYEILSNIKNIEIRDRSVWMYPVDRILDIIPFAVSHQQEIDNSLNRLFIPPTDF